MGKRSDVKSLCLLALPEPDNESAEYAGRLIVWPTAGVPGTDDEGVNSPLSDIPLRLPTSAVINSSTSLLEDDAVGV